LNSDGKQRGGGRLKVKAVARRDGGEWDKSDAGIFFSSSFSVHFQIRG
jgi:hypothetical protein